MIETDMRNPRRSLVQLRAVVSTEIFPGLARFTKTLRIKKNFSGTIRSDRLGWSGHG
jgi:hypothetical protein